MLPPPLREYQPLFLLVHNSHLLPITTTKAARYEKGLILHKAEVVSPPTAAAAGGEESWGVTDVNYVVCEATILGLLLLIPFDFVCPGEPHTQ